MSNLFIDSDQEFLAEFRALQVESKALWAVCMRIREQHYRENLEHNLLSPNYEWKNLLIITVYAKTMVGG